MEKIACGKCQNRFTCGRLPEDCPLDTPPKTELHPIEVVIDTSRNFTSSDLLYIYARQTPGAYFGHTKYGEAVLFLSGRRYLYDHWEILEDKVRLWMEET